MGQKTQAEIEAECLAEIEKILTKYNCSIDVSFQSETVLGQPVLKYQPIVVFKEESK